MTQALAKNSMMAFINAALTTPFRSKGRELGKGMDCYGLWWLFQRHCLGVKNPPDYIDSYGNAMAWQTVHRLISKERKLWQEQTAPARGDLVLLRASTNEHSSVCHVGVMISSGLFAEIDEGWRGARVNRLSNPLYRHRIEGFYRYAD